MPDVDLHQRVAARLAVLAPEADRVLLGLSGGADSVAALHLLKRAGVELAAGHFDHRLRASSADDAAFVRHLCRELGVPLAEGGADVGAVARQRGWNLEDGARRLRYAFLGEAARERGAQVVVVAHTLEDQAETVLLQLLRGAAFARGMPPRRGRLVRPLLEVARAELRGYLEERGLPWREDASNLDTGRTRAWLRAEVLPLLEGRSPGAGARLSRTAALQRDAAAALDELAQLRFGDGPLQVEGLRRAPLALQRAALARLLRRSGAPVGAERVEEARAALARRAPWRADIGGGRVLRVAYGRVEVASRAAAGPVVAVTRPEQLPAGVSPGVLESHAALELRGRRPGDRIRLPGGRRRLSDLLIDAKVPREERDAVRVLASGNEVLWVEGLALAVDVADPDGAAGTSGDPDVTMMRRALRLAEAAAAGGELPVGAVVAQAGRVLGEGANASEAEHDPTAHAEIRALREAAARVGDWRLSGATLVVTLEPCPMCLGAALQAHVGRLVYGAENRREGALGGVLDLRAGAWKRTVEVRPGVLGREASALLRAFFAAQRRG